MKYKILPLIFMIIIFAVSAYAVDISSDDFECNGFNCGTGWNSAWAYTGDCDISTLSSPIDSYHMRGQNGCNAGRSFDSTGYTEVIVSFYATATSLETADTCDFYYNDGTTDHLILQLVNGDDDGTHDFYQYDITSYGLNSNAQIKMVALGSTGDYCYIDNIAITGTQDIQFNIFPDSTYSLGEVAQIEMSSSLASTSHELELYDDGDALFCNRTITSPPSPFTSFYATCTMPITQQVNAYATLYETGSPGTSTTEYFNVSPITQDPNMLQIKKAYFSPQVLQGGSTEVFSLIQKDPSITIEKSKITLTFPDNSQRDLSVSPTENTNEYRAFITDTYQTGNVSFVLRFEGGNYYDTYTGQYTVAGYNVDFVDVVNKVAEVAVCKKVEDIPDEEISVFGTEYRQEETATIFLQLKDSQGFPVNDGMCYFDMYHPNILNHTKHLSNTPMLYLDGSAGLYYYDITELPVYSGVYMLTASCSYSTAQQFVYATDGTDSDFPTRTGISGTFSTSPIVLNSYVDGLYSNCYGAGGATKYCDAYYDFNLSHTISNASEINGMSLFFMGEASTTAGVNFSVYNWSSGSWKGLPNILTFSGLATSGIPTGLNDFVSNSIPINGTIDPSTLVVRVRVTSWAGTAFDQYINWLNINLVNEYGNVIDLKGSGEIHINDWFANYTQLIANEVWTWNQSSGRTLTGETNLWIGGTEYSEEEETGKVVARLVDNTNTPVNNANCNLTIAYPNNTIQSVNSMYLFNNGTGAGGIWIADFNLTQQYGVYPYGIDCYVEAGASPRHYYLLDTFHIFDINQTKLAKVFWNSSDRNLTYYAEDQIWAYTNRSLSNFEFSYKVWEYTNRSLTYVDNIVDSVWNYATRTLTAFGFDVVDETEVGQYVWNTSTRNLTYYEAPTASVNETRIGEYVWNTSTRNLTYYETPTASVNTTEIAINTWNYSARYTHGVELT